MKPIFRSFLTEINFTGSAPGAGAVYNWATINELRDVWITGFECFWGASLVKSPAGKTVVNISNAPGIVVTISDTKSQSHITQMPSTDLTPVLQTGFYRDFVPFQLDLTKSYITILDPGTIAANESFVANILYLRADEFKPGAVKPGSMLQYK
jgi:hypothetical protein